jgi:hypothetical protein
MDNQPRPLDTFEQQLQAVALPPLAIDRDRLMFESGWQAALAQQRRAERGAWLHGPWLWQATSAVGLATSLVLALLLVRQPGEPVQVAQQPLASEASQEVATGTAPAVESVARPSSPEASDEPATSTTPSRWLVWNWMAAPLDPQLARPDTPSLIGWRSQLASSASPGQLANTPASETQPTTARDLLAEMLGS